MDLGLNGRRALVLASTRGLGRAIAAALAAEGAVVRFCGRTGAEEVAARIAEETGAAVHGRDCDLHDRSALDALIDDATVRMGGIDFSSSTAAARRLPRRWPFSRTPGANGSSAWSAISSMPRRDAFQTCVNAAGDVS